MTSLKRTLALLFALAALTTPLFAACRADSPLDIKDIIDPAGTTITRVDSRNFLVFFAVRNNANVSFVCNRNVPGCTTDGITFKPALSSNVAAAFQTAECRAFQITTTASGVVVAGFRIRFEAGSLIAPRRETYKLTFNTNTPSQFTLTSVPSTDADDL